MRERFIKREILGQLEAHLAQKEITFLVGPRQAGKTTLMLLLQEQLQRRGERRGFLNLDIEADQRFFGKQADLVKKLDLELGKNHGVAFIDEIQRKENAGIFLKGLYDMRLPYKFIVSGSGSVELKERIHESLVGRKRVFELSTLTFREFVNFKTNDRYEKRLDEYLHLHAQEAQRLLGEYLSLGGYPRVLLEERADEKRKLIDEICQSYLEKDIAYLLKIRKTENLSHLVKVIASQIGQPVNFSEPSATPGIAHKTLKDYRWYLQKTFILHKVTPYFRNVRKEITKTPVF